MKIDHSHIPIHIRISAKILAPFIKTFNALRDIGDLIVRWWVAKIFFMSALSKTTDWGGTLVLFKYDYHVPWLNPAFAAYLGTAFEFILPVFFILGLGGRLTIFIFFIYNVICVISFNYLWTPAGYTGLTDHVNWGLLLMLLMFYGPGRLSLDYLIEKRYGSLLEITATK